MCVFELCSSVTKSKKILLYRGGTEWNSRVFISWRLPFSPFQPRSKVKNRMLIAIPLDPCHTSHNRVVLGEVLGRVLKVNPLGKNGLSPLNTCEYVSPDTRGPPVQVKPKPKSFSYSGPIADPKYSFYFMVKRQMRGIFTCFRSWKLKGTSYNLIEFGLSWPCLLTQTQPET